MIMITNHCCGHPSGNDTIHDKEPCCALAREAWTQKPQVTDRMDDNKTQSKNKGTGTFVSLITGATGRGALEVHQLQGVTKTPSARSVNNVKVLQVNFDALEEVSLHVIR